AFRNEYRRARHSFYPCSVEESQRAANHHHAWVARVDHRAIEDYRSPNESNRTRWKGRGLVRCRDSVASWLRLLRQTDEARVESRQHCESVGDADATPRLHQVRGAGRRL